MKQTEDNYQ